MPAVDRKRRALVTVRRCTRARSVDLVNGRSVTWLAVVVATAVAACEPTGPTSGSAPEREALGDSTPVSTRDADAPPEVQFPAASARSGAVRGDEPADSPGTVAADTTGTAEQYLSDTRYATADIQRGRILSLACQACHTLGAGEDHNLGPNLHGMFGRPAAQLEGFEYSDALRASGLVWTPSVLESWLAEPDDFVPGNNMVFAGYASESDRRDLLAWLLTATSGLER